MQGKDRETGAARWTGTRVDLVFGANSQLRDIAEVYAQADAEQHFINDFVNAWVKVRRDRSALRLTLEESPSDWR